MVQSTFIWFLILMTGYSGQYSHTYSDQTSYARPSDSSSVMSVDSLNAGTEKDGVAPDKIMIVYQAIDRQCGSCHQREKSFYEHKSSRYLQPRG